ncbi:MAG: hypothetical protein LH654_15060 [Thermoleophilia bacterium]|nr:hypothetical protein [Thermoleophilia bacterium]
MIRRTTLAAETDDLTVLEGEARRRGVSLAHVLRELVAARADEVRRSRRPRFGIVSSGHGGLADRSWQDEDAPYQDESPSA